MIQLRDPILAGEMGICARCASQLRANSGLPPVTPDSQVDRWLLEELCMKSPTCPKCQRTLTPGDFGFQNTGQGLEKKRWVNDKGEWVNDKPFDFTFSGFKAP